MQPSAFFRNTGAAESRIYRSASGKSYSCMQRDRFLRLIIYNTHNLSLLNCKIEYLSRILKISRAR